MLTPTSELKCWLRAPSPSTARLIGCDRLGFLPFCIVFWWLELQELQTHAATLLSLEKHWTIKLSDQQDLS